MNAFLDLTVYDKRRSKPKEGRQNTKQFREKTKSTEKLRDKQKSNNRSDRVNKATRNDKTKKEIGKSYESIVSIDDTKLTSTLPANEVKVISEHGKNGTKSDNKESIELRNKTAKSSDSPNKTYSTPHDAMNGFSYSGSIELKFEEALEVCSDNLYDEIDEEFGRNLFDEESDNYILEAYNSPGNELVETYMEIEYKRVSKMPDMKNQKTNVKFLQNVQKEEEKNNLGLVSEDEECVFIEAYNSIGHELRKTYGFVDKSLSRKSMEDNVKKKTPSTSSDVRDYLKEMERKCETEDFPLAQSSNNVYVNYSRIVKELKSNIENLTLKSPKLDETDSEDANSQSSDELSYMIPSAPNTITFTPQTKSDFIIHELLETELVYINNLKKILNDYLSYFRKFPIELQVKVDAIFGNIEQIYKQTAEFYQALLMCSNDYEAIGLTFMDYKELFKLYPTYMKNKPKADRILLENYKSLIEERQKKLRDRLDLMSYLLNPIQRLGRYILLMENLQKSVRRSECLDPAIEMLKYNMTKGNDAIAVESILKAPGKLDLYKKGSYVDREKFTMIKPRRQEIVIFLFEEILVFTVENLCTRGDVHTTFTYVSSIDMNDLSITIVDGELQTFELKDYPKCKVNKEEGTYVFEAKDKKTRDNWGALIQGKLWAQLEKFKNQSKSYKSVARANSTPLSNVNKYHRNESYMTSASTSVSRENSTKSKKDADKNEATTSKQGANGASTKSNYTLDEKRQTDRSSEKGTRRTRKPRNGMAKRSSRFYTDPQNFKTM